MDPYAAVANVAPGSGDAQRPARQKLSCAECRRLKLKCSRSWPCTSCVKRQCTDLCPDGVMKPESRLARAKEIAGLLDRISSLESALRTERARNGSAALGPAPDMVTAQPEPNSTAFGNLTLHSDDERSRFLGPGSASALIDHDSSAEEDDLVSDDGEDVMSLSEYTGSGPFTTPSPRDAFPFTSGVSGIVRLADMLALLPPRDEAAQLGDIYFDQFVSFEPLQRDVWLRVHLPMAYREPCTDPYGVVAMREVHPHRLALVFAILACGALNVTGSMAQAQARGQGLMAIAQTCLSASRFISHPTIASVQTLLVFCQYFNALGRVESVWPVSGLALRLAQATGLHRDAAAWNIGQPECDQRRALWAEVLHMDAITALMLGRPCGVSGRHFDAQRPTGEGLRWDQPTNCDGDTGVYHLAKWRLTSLIHRIVDSAFGVETPSIEVIMHLDREIRDFTDSLAESVRFRPLGTLEDGPICLRTIMQRNHLALFTQEITLFLHRAQFAAAVQECPDEPLRSSQAYSVVTVLCESCKTIVEVVRAAEPTYPTGVPFRRGIVPLFGAAVCQAALIIRSPGSLLARHAWDELCGGVELLERASVDMNLAAALLPRLRRLQEQALRKLELWHSSTTPAISTFAASGQNLSPPKTAPMRFTPPGASPSPRFRPSPGDEGFGDSEDGDEELRTLSGGATLSYKQSGRPRGRQWPSSPGHRTPMQPQTPSTPTRSSIQSLSLRPISLEGIDGAILERIGLLVPDILSNVGGAQSSNVFMPAVTLSMPSPSHSYVVQPAAADYPGFDFSLLQSPMTATFAGSYTTISPVDRHGGSYYSAAFPPSEGHAPGAVGPMPAATTMTAMPLDMSIGAMDWPYGGVATPMTAGSLSYQLQQQHLAQQHQTATHQQQQAAVFRPGVDAATIPFAITPRTVYDDLLSAALGGPSARPSRSASTSSQISPQTAGSSVPPWALPTQSRV